MKNKSIKGTLILLVTALIWGGAFAAQSSASGLIGSFGFNAARSFIAAALLFAAVCISAHMRSRPLFSGRELFGGTMCGVFLFIATNLQQFGIAAYPAGVASSGRSGFLTATYVIIVALLSPIVGKKVRISAVISAAGCLLGMYFLCLGGGVSGFYTADILVFACALAFSAQILAVDKFSALDSLRLSCVQFAVCFLLSAAGAAVFEDNSAASFIGAAPEIIYAGVMSSCVGYTLQMVGQKYAPPAVASVTMSLESVFAALAGWAILGEKLSGTELFGCCLVFASVVFAQIPFGKKKQA